MVHGQQYCELVERLRQRTVHAAGRRRSRDEIRPAGPHPGNDALTRDLAIPQLARLGELLGRMKRQQTLLSAYGYQAPET